ncbi:MAG TPA: DUF5818 domain-containing protein, partial [Thermoanaerobaculia bacterium]
MTRTRDWISGRGLRLALLLAGVLALSACAVESPAYYRQGPQGQQGQIDGFITFEGRCPTIRDHETNEAFGLTGNVRALRPGDHVALSERAVGGRACGVNAPTLEVLSIDAVWRGDDHRDAWFDARRDGDFDSFIAQSRDRGGWYADRYAYLHGGGEQAPGRPGPYDRDQDRDRGGYGNPPPPPPPPGMENPGEDRDDEEEQEELSVTGRLDLRGSCPAIHTPNGDSWDLAGDLGDYRDGDRVRVLGYPAGTSSCGGRALRVEEVQAPQ